MPIFDTHAHYDDSRFDGDRDAVLAALPETGVELVLDPGCDLPSSRAAAALAERYSHVYAAAGIHPENCAGFQDADLVALRQLLAQPKVAAIGEIGLDYYWAENPPRELQQDVLRRQMTLAQELSLPVIIHDRDAHADTMAIVREFPRVTGVFHCFAGSVEMARELLALGWMLSFNGAITFKNARRAPGGRRRRAARAAHDRDGFPLPHTRAAPRRAQRLFLCPLRGGENRRDQGHPL